MQPSGSSSWPCRHADPLIWRTHRHDRPDARRPVCARVREAVDHEQPGAAGHVRAPVRGRVLVAAIPISAIAAMLVGAVLPGVVADNGPRGMIIRLAICIVTAVGIAVPPPLAAARRGRPSSVSDPRRGQGRARCGVASASPWRPTPIDLAVVVDALRPGSLGSSWHDTTPTLACSRASRRCFSGPSISW